MREDFRKHFAALNENSRSSWPACLPPAGVAGPSTDETEDVDGVSPLFFVWVSDLLKHCCNPKFSPDFTLVLLPDPDTPRGPLLSVFL